MKFPSVMERLIESFQSLPGIGPKSAQRIAFHLLHFPKEHLDNFAKNLSELKDNTKLCQICKNITESDVCNVCSDLSRDQSKIVVVSSAMDAFALNRVGYKGLFHVLHGVIDPLNGIGPEQLFIDDLLTRLSKHLENLESVEVILATNTSMEGESTAMYISKLIESADFRDKIRLTRIARGLPVGGDIEFADDVTLTRALEGRSLF